MITFLSDANSRFIIVKFYKYNCNFSSKMHIRQILYIVSLQLQDNEIIEKARDVIEGKSKTVTINTEIRNEVRTFGSTLSYHISRWVT